MAHSRGGNFCSLANEGNKIFSDRAMSLSYAGKIIWVLNEWGYFLSDEEGKSFRPLPHPRGYDRGVIADAFLSSGKKRKESAPLDPEALQAAECKLSPPHYRWLYITEWFGLRPIETDGLPACDDAGNPTNWKVERDVQGTEILLIYQTKLTSLLPERRWKRIPVILPEQKKALEMIVSGAPIKRPLPKTVQKYLGQGVMLYGGRKAFEGLMLDHGQRLEDVFAMMGHQSIDTLWKNYRNRQKARYTLPAAASAEGTDGRFDPVA